MSLAITTVALRILMVPRNVFDKKDLREDRKPEERGLQCIALAGERKPLVDLHNADGGTAPSDITAL